ncbi:ras GEF [Rhizodiscina lignyota]|uniref:Ras GEF n=1 Tax=Rhizodiscina lignyota TaxID=1504668 RepID=A0A9P4I749_9PEZI|nr:ras GEF [Rhizodiscina lignyota]
MHEINIAVLGAAGVGKSSFIQRVFDHRAPPTLTVTPRKMSIDGEEYTVRLIELSFDDLEFDDSHITWPDAADSRPLPPIDGVLTLYDVMNKESLTDVPETLRAVYKSSLPFHLVACKCDNHPNLRHIDPVSVSQRAKALIGAVNTFETSETQPGTQKRCLFALLRVIVNARYDHPAVVTARRRANSAIPRPRSVQKHSRASSELSGSMSKSAQNLPEAVARSGGPSQSIVNLSNAASYDTLRSGPTSGSEQEPSAATIQKERPSIEKGYTWDQLIDRLLSQPLSKADVKFVSVFLALFRAFAAPGQLLEAILRRFNEVSLNDAIPEMSRTVIQLRHLAVLEQWASTYPGDFAHPATRASMCRFVALISNTRIFSVAAREIAADLEVVAEDDDTDWACCDRNRARPDTMLTFMSEASTLHEENWEDLIRELSGMSFTGAMNQTAPITPTSNVARSPATSSASTGSSSGQTMLAAIEAAAVQARTMKPNPRLPLTKAFWHALMDAPDESIAKELTRMDWTMFQSIRPRDLVRHVSLNAEQKRGCRSLENVNRMIEHFNHLAWWVANFVLMRDKPKHRALMLEKFMRVARKLRELNNYNSLGAIIAGINSTSVHRLQATRELISSLIVRDFMKLEILMGTQKSHFAYRLAWENSSGERIPYIPLHRRDLVSALEGNRTWMEGSEKMEAGGSMGSGGSQMVRRYITDGKERINWKKFEIMGEVIVGVQSAQSVPMTRLGKNDIVRESVLEVRINKDDDVSAPFPGSFRCLASGPLPHWTT